MTLQNGWLGLFHCYNWSYFTLHLVSLSSNSVVSSISFWSGSIASSTDTWIFLGGDFCWRIRIHGKSPVILDPYLGNSFFFTFYESNLSQHFLGFRRVGAIEQGFLQVLQSDLICTHKRPFGGLLVRRSRLLKPLAVDLLEDIRQSPFWNTWSMVSTHG